MCSLNYVGPAFDLFVHALCCLLCNYVTSVTFCEITVVNHPLQTARFNSDRNLSPLSLSFETMPRKPLAIYRCESSLDIRSHSDLNIGE